MAPNVATLFCYWGGKICDGPEGALYTTSPSKAIKVPHGIEFDELINKLYLVTSFDKEKYSIRLVCRYPSVVGKVMRYVRLPVNDNDDIEIMFDALSLHPELSNIDLYLEVEEIGRKRSADIAFGCRTQEFVENEATLPREIVEETRNSQVVDINDGACIDDVIEGDETGDGDEVDNDFQVPSCFTRIENIEMATADYDMMSRSESKNDLTRELGKSSFFDKEELIRAIKLYSIKNRIQFEVVETCPTIWRIRCKLFSESGCKWQVRACKRKRSGYFEITKYTGPHTCLDRNISPDHPNLDARLISQEIEHIVREEPSVSISVLRVKILDKLGYNVSYKKAWSAKQKAFEQIFGKETLRLRIGMDVKEGKVTNLCGICKESGHNRKTCLSRS